MADKGGLKCAIALNNMGVSMVERHCYKQAFQTFRDAANVIRTAVTSAVTAPTLSPGGEALSSANPQTTKIQDAVRRVSRPDVSKVSLRIEAVSDSDNLSSIAFPNHFSYNSCTALGNCIPHVYHPVRIDTDDSDFLESIDGNDVYVCIILLNFSLAHLIRVKITKNPTLRSALIETSMKISHLIRTILSTMFETCQEDDSSSGGEATLPRLLLISALTLWTSADAMTQAGQVTAAKDCLTTLSDIRKTAAHTLSNQIASFGRPTENIPAAAAA